jgi:hypothetical protein
MAVVPLPAWDERDQGAVERRSRYFDGCGVGPNDGAEPGPNGGAEPGPNGGAEPGPNGGAEPGPNGDPGAGSGAGSRWA